MKTIHKIIIIVFLVFSVLLVSVLVTLNKKPPHTIHRHFQTIGNISFEALDQPDDNGDFKVIIHTTTHDHPFIVKQTIAVFAKPDEFINKDLKGLILNMGDASEEAYTKVIDINVRNGLTH